MQLTRRSAVAVGAVAIVIGASAGAGLANATGQTDQVFACASKSNGALRIVNAGTGCKPSEESVVWNLTSSQGDGGADS